MPTIQIANIYSVPDGSQYPWTYTGTNTFSQVDVKIYINAIIPTILQINGSGTGWTVQYTSTQTIITMSPYAIPDGTTGNAPPMQCLIEYSAVSNTINTTIYTRLTFTYNPTLVSAGCDTTYTFTSNSMPVEF